MSKLDLRGRSFGRLKVIRETPGRASREVVWDCRCRCGTITSVPTSRLRRGVTRSCGCLRRELSSKRARKLFTKPPRKCSVAECKLDQRTGDHGFCSKHAQRFRRYGDANFVISEDARRMNLRLAQPNLGKGRVYRKFLGRHAHRVEAEKMLNRKLKPGEIVHHRNGNALDNSHSNLQVMTQAEHARLHNRERHARTT